MPDCSNAFPGQYVQDTDNCHNYYICPVGEDSEACPDGGCFNTVGICAEVNSAYCSTHCPGTDKTTAFTTITPLLHKNTGREEDGRIFSDKKDENLKILTHIICLPHI